MANTEHLEVIKQGVAAWFEWRMNNPRNNRDIKPDLTGANLSGMNLKRAYLRDTDLAKANLSWADLAKANLSGAHLSKADLSGANLTGANLCRADLNGAYLHKANLNQADLSGANLTGANLSEANLRGADLDRAKLKAAILCKADFNGANLNRATLGGANLNGAILNWANLREAHLKGANLEYSSLVKANLKKAILTDCSIFGISAWGVELEGAEQKNLIITDEDEPFITVDNLEVAQFIYLILNNHKLREVIDTITSKVVLILGRFTLERKAVLDAIRDELRKRNYLPLLFDFDSPTSRDLDETVTILARLARFIIADITEPKSVPQELVSIVQSLPSVPVQPILKSGSEPWGMYEHIARYPWVLRIYQYSDLDDLLSSLDEYVIAPAAKKADECKM